MGRVNGLEGVPIDIVMMRTPDEHGRLELTKWSVMFTVESVDDTIASLRAVGAELVGSVAQ